MTAALIRGDHLAIARSFAADRTWMDRVRFDAANRWYSRLHAGPDAEVWLLSWLPGQGTDLHDHGGSAGAFLVVRGCLVEETPEGGGLVGTEYVTGRARRFDERHVHRITNRDAEPAVSIHVYGPALSSMTRYEFDGERLRVLAVERAGVSW